MSLDYSLEASTGHVVAHRPDCPDVRALADTGEPVATLLDCAVPLAPDVTRHGCLAGEKIAQECVWRLAGSCHRNEGCLCGTVRI